MIDSAMGFGVAMTLTDGFSSVAQNIASSFGKLEGVTGNMMSKMNSHMNSFGTGMGLAAAGMAILAPLGHAVSVSMDFNKQISKVAAVSGATAEELLLLKNQAIALGSATEWSSKQAAEAQTFLAMSGMKTQQVMTAMPSVLSLASAGQLELGKAADMATDHLAMFGLQASDTARVADVMALTANSFSTDTYQFGNAMEYMGATARAVGVSYEETSAVIGLLADNGKKGSVATRVLSTALMRFADSTPKMRAVMSELGVDMFDAQGKFKGMAGMIEEMEKATKGMNPEESLGAIAKIFGAEAAPNIMLLMNAGKDFVTKTGETIRVKGAGAIRAFTGQLEDSAGSADRIAKMMLDNLAGDVAELGSSWEGLMIGIGDPLEKALRPFARGLIGVINGFTDFANTGFGAFVVKITAGFGVLLTVTGVVIMAVSAFKMALLAAGPVLAGLGASAAAALVPLLPFVAAGAAIYGIFKLASHSIEVFDKYMKGTAGSMTGFNKVFAMVGGGFRGLQEVFSSVSKDGFALSEDLNNALRRLGVLDFVTTVGSLISKALTFWEGFKTAFLVLEAPVIQLKAAFSEMFRSIGESLQSVGISFGNGSDSAAVMGEKGASMGKMIADALVWVVQGITTAVGWVTTFNDKFNWVGQTIHNVMLGVGLLFDVVGAIGTYIMNQISNIGNLIATIFENPSEIFNALGAYFEASAENTKQLFFSVFTAVAQFFVDRMGAMLPASVSEMLGLTPKEGPAKTNSQKALGTSEYATKAVLTSGYTSEMSPTDAADQMRKRQAEILATEIQMRTANNRVADSNNITVQPAPVYVTIDGKVVAKVVNEENERNTNLSYGSYGRIAD